MNKNSSLVIGAGFAGLSAACFLAKHGQKVTLIDKHNQVGGRSRTFRHEDFLFDMGPSWYWMPDVFERFFASFGRKTSDYYDLKRLDPSYRIYFGPNDTLDVPANPLELASLLEEIEPGAEKKLLVFLEEASHKYTVGINDLVFKPGLSLAEFAHPGFLSGVLKLDVFSSHSKHIRKFFKHPKIIQLLEFPVLFLGAKPSKTPALYSLMNYADLQLGTWYPMGGMSQIAKGMAALATELGVEFCLGEALKEFSFNGKRITHATTEKRQIEADNFVAGADYHHIDQQILPLDKRSYSESYWDSRTLAPSSLIFYLGFNKKIDGLLHHNLFFDQPFDQHAEEIYDNPMWPTSPLFYVCAPSKTHPGVAAPNHENLFVLIPVAPGIEDPEDIRNSYLPKILSRIEKMTGQSNLAQHLIFSKSYAHKEFISDYNSFKGNAYGLANTLRQTAILKPSLKSKKIQNLYFTGQLTVPGPGIPPAIISGEVVANQIKKEHQR